jgi:hypothetical protein
MNSLVHSAAAPPETGPLPDAPAAVVEIRSEGSRLVCVSADGRELSLSRLVGSHVRVGDEVLIHSAAAPATTDAEI